MADAIRVRRQSQRLADLAREEATFRDLLELAARAGSLVDIATSAGHTHAGRIELVAQDHVRLRTSRGIGLIATAAVLQVSERSGTVTDLDPDLGPKSGGQAWEHAPARLVHALERLIGTEIVIRLALAAGSQETSGELESVGEDYVVVRREAGARPGRAYARFEAVAEAWPFISG